MNLLGPVTTPLRSLAFALGGALLAWSWYNLNPVVPLAVVALAWLITILVQRWADGLITTDPKKALSLLEFRLVGIAIVSAGAAALVIVVTVWFTLDKAVADALATSTSKVIAAVSAALTSFVGGIALSAEKMDGNVGDVVMEKFREKFSVNEEAGPGQVRIDSSTPAGELADKALNSSTDFGWTDWSSKYRKKRVDAIAAYLESSISTQG